jgi:hypothetical protein
VVPALFRPMVHLHAYNLQGNEKFEQNCVAGDYASMTGWDRWKQAAVSPSALLGITSSGVCRGAQNNYPLTRALTRIPMERTRGMILATTIV